MEVHHAGDRLITQNLLAAAALCEHDERMTWGRLEELSILIDLVCLYDQVWIMGRQALDMLAALQSGPYVTCQSAFHVGEFGQAGVVDAASRRLARYFHDPAGPGRYRALLETILAPSAIKRAFQPLPDADEDYELGELWLRTLPEDRDPVAALSDEDALSYRSTAFFLRSFLYIAYAEAQDIPLTPDRARFGSIQGLLENERLLRRQLMQKLKASVEDSAIIGDIHVIRSTTPLAAKVFEMAANRREIWQAVAELRNELWSTRATLRAAEDDLFWATQKEQARAAAKWDAAFDELQRTYGKGQGIVSCDVLIGFGEQGFETLIDHSKWPGLASMVIDPIKRAFARRPIIELHKLAGDLPGAGQTQRHIKRLFGTVTVD
jgi:hypothetical protein